MKILIADDERSITEFFAQLARARGHTEIDTVASSEEALNQALRGDYDLITLDICMPGASGLEIVAMLRNMNPHAVLAVISGFISDEISEEVLNCIDLLLSKPVSVATFNQLVGYTEQICCAMDKIRLLGKA